MIENNKKREYWDSLDFYLNKLLWSHRGSDKSINIRVNNLKEISSIFNEEKLTFFLEGRTLENIVLHDNLLVSDHDDDIGIFKNNINILKDNVIPKLIKLGFKIIRSNSDMISIIKDDRYIDICFFEIKEKNTIGYGEKIFDEKYYLSFDKIKFEDEYFNTPNDCENYLKIRYQNKGIKLKEILRKIKWFLKIPFKLFSRVQNIILSREKLITQKKFENLYVESNNAVNWKLRKPHMDIVTNNGKNIKIKDIIKYFKEQNNLNKILNKVIETKMTCVFSDPIHIDRSFWQTGNNYFIYCIKYQFMKGVVPYNETNNYISKDKTPELYTKDYFESLEPFSEKELKTFLENNPIEITKGAITSGRHRVYAMIGRLIDNKAYVPFKAKVIY